MTYKNIKIKTAVNEHAAFPRRAPMWKNDGELADALENAAAHVVGMADRTALTKYSTKLQQIYFDLSDLSEKIDRMS